jgi:DNA-binding transcriptional ArsR family regulator
VRAQRLSFAGGCGFEFPIRYFLSVLSVGVSTPTISNHLSVLVDAGFLRSEKEGRWVHYHLVQNPQTAEVASMLPLLHFWMNEDDQIKSDRVKL